MAKIYLVFKITIFWLTIPFNETVLSKIDVGVNVGVNGVNVGVNDKEKMILDMLLNDPTLTAGKISSNVKKSKSTIKRYFKTLQEKGYLERSGPDKTCVWKII